MSPMTGTLLIARAIDALNRRVARLATFCTLLMVLVSAANALLRHSGKALGASLTSNAWLELQWVLFSLVFLLGAPHLLRRDGHVRVDVFFARFSPRTRAFVDLLGTLLLLIPFCLFALLTSCDFVADSLRTLEGSPDPGGLPRWPVKLLVPIAFLLLLLQALAEALRRIAFLRGAPRELALPNEEAA